MNKHLPAYFRIDGDISYTLKVFGNYDEVYNKIIE